LADRALKRIDGDLDELYSSTGRESIPPERLLRALLLMVLYSVRSERQLMEQLDYNLLFRWFVGLQMDDAVWDVTVFTKNRERLIGGEISQRLLVAVMEEARQHNLLSAEHFTVDGTLIPAWAASRSFHPKQYPPARGQGSGSRGELLLRDKVESRTDGDALLYKKAAGAKSVPSYLGHACMENRHELVVAAEASCAGNAAERTAALAMLDRVVKPKAQRDPAAQVTLGADTQYQEAKFVQELRARGVAPHISAYAEDSSNAWKNCLTTEERADSRCLISQQKRRRIERLFGWSKLDRPLRQTKLRGLKRVDWFFRLVVSAYNLRRMVKLIPLQVA
jgi:transposase